MDPIQDAPARTTDEPAVSSTGELVPGRLSGRA